LGFFVFAGQRNISNEVDSENVKYLKMDIENEEEIIEALNIIKKSEKKLYAVINNAGIGANR
jgi:NADP-dependent 3-hydroxy acid dehydrogenase YdfG